MYPEQHWSSTSLTNKISWIYNVINWQSLYQYAHWYHFYWLHMFITWTCTLKYTFMHIICCTLKCKLNLIFNQHFRFWNLHIARISMKLMCQLYHWYTKEAFYNINIKIKLLEFVFKKSFWFHCWLKRTKKRKIQEGYPKWIWSRYSTEMNQRYISWYHSIHFIFFKQKLTDCISLLLNFDKAKWI